MLMRRAPLLVNDYSAPPLCGAFNGTLNKVSIKLGPWELLPEDHKAEQEMKDNLNK